MGGPDDLRGGGLIRATESENGRGPAPERLAPDQAPADRAVPERGEEPEQQFLK
jgi:hypothetical protein